MAIAPLSLRPDYWDTIEIQEQDLENLYNYLLEIETPLTSQELVQALIRNRIDVEKDALKNQKPAGAAVYLPKEHYQTNQTLVFPALEWKRGKVIRIRPGNNPELPPFEVLEVTLETGEQHQFAAGLEDHRLNQPIEINIDDPKLDPQVVYKQYGVRLVRQLEASLDANPDLVRIAGSWFPRALLVDVNIGHLNLAEAVLDMEGGGPLPTKSVLDQIELPTDVNLKLTEFSLNLALQEDSRFDEVGPAGEILWFLHRLEPETVREIPPYLRYHPTAYDRSQLTPPMLELEADLDDDLSEIPFEDEAPEEITFRLTYPHLRAGTLPLTDRIRRLFPTAYESPRIRFTLLLGEEQQRVPGWVVRPNHYIFGLREWYLNQELIPGTIIHIRKSKNAGEVIIRAEKHRPTREWIRTVLVGADGGIVFAMLKQVLHANYDERMAVAVPDANALDPVWAAPKKQNFEQVVMNTMRELAKLNLQGHVHAQELYAAVNIIRRSPPGPILAILASRPGLTHVGDLHYRIDENAQSESEV